jgi:hypothetical protein
VRALEPDTRGLVRFDIRRILLHDGGTFTGGARRLHGRVRGTVIPLRYRSSDNAGVCSVMPSRRGHFMESEDARTAGTRQSRSAGFTKRWLLPCANGEVTDGDTDTSLGS